MPVPSSWIDPTNLLLPVAGARMVACAPALEHAEFAGRCLRLAAGLRRRGVRRAALWLGDAAELAIALYACWRADVVAVLPGEVLPASCERIDRDVDLWLSDAQLPLETARVHRPAAITQATPLSPCRLEPSSAGVVLHTSGSSGAPKPILKRWTQLVLEVRALEQRWPARAPACVLGSVNPHHMFGLPFRVLWPMAAGHCIDRDQRHYPEELADASLRHERCIWVASPALLHRIGERVDWADLRPRLSAIYSAGGPLSTQVSEKIAAAGAPRPIEIYGSSETGAVATRQGAGSWQLLEGVHAEIDPEGALCVSSPWLASARERTADAALLGPEGMQLAGRLDRIVKVEEKRIALPAVEAAIEDHPYVAQAHVGLRADKPRLCALLALSDAGVHALRNGGRHALVAALRQHLERRLEPLSVPRTWRLLRRIPWNSQGKLPIGQFLELTGPRPREPRFEVLDVAPGGEWQARFEVPPDLAHFSGHFPATPVVPGVAQIGWAMQAARQHLLPDLRFCGVENLKFQRLMRPLDEITLTLRWDASRGKLTFTYRHGDGPCSSGRIVHTHDPSPA